MSGDSDRFDNICKKTNAILEWKTAAARDKFEASPDAAAMHESWRSVFAAPVHVAAYRWPFPAVARETALSSSYDTVSVLFTWHFSNDNMIDEKTWTESFDPFRRAVMTSPVGGIFDYCIAGWHLDRWTFAAVFHCHSVDSTKKWLETKDVREVLDVTRTRGGARDLSIEYMETKVYKEGWCGSVRKERPDNPQVAAMFARFQQGKGRIFGQ